MTVLVSLSEFTIKRNKWFILYKGVLKGLKRGGFQGEAFLSGNPRVLFGNRNGAPPHCDFRRERASTPLKKLSPEIPPFLDP